MKKAFFLLISIMILTNIFAQNFTGDGGKGMSLTILVPDSQGLTKAEDYLPSMIQGILVQDIAKFSAISVFDRLNLEKVLRETESGIYKNEADFMRLGEITNTDYTLTGRITKTGSGFALQIQIVSNTNGNTRASHSGSLTLAELDNFTGIRRASLDLLNQMGVTLTASAKNELTGAETQTNVSAQRALAQGITAQKQGTEVTALSYFFQASASDPSLLEALNRSLILNTNITSGNIGMDVRNEIAWRKQWVDRLTETEEFFYNYFQSNSLPYTFYYVNDIRQGSINWKTESVDLFIKGAFLVPQTAWFTPLEKTLQAVYDGLQATGKAQYWELANWPQRGVTERNAFAQKNNNFNVVIELVNSQNKVISKSTVELRGSWQLNRSGNKQSFAINSNNLTEIKFSNVNANDIDNNLTIRFASVNGQDVQTAMKNFNLQILTYKFQVGDNGPAGGIVFYDKGNFSNGWQYLEAAPADEPTTAQWGAYGENVARTQVGIGTGKANTDIIVAFPISRGAAQLCADKTLNGFSDWFLPSKDELNQMYLNLHKKGLGGFKNESYWSSSQGTDYYSNAWGQSFNSGYHASNFKNHTYRVRAVRFF